MHKVKKMSECPICGGEVQFTEVHETYGHYESIEFVIMEDGNVAVNGSDEAHDYDDPQWVETRIYCENDHTEQQMCAYISLSAKQEVN